MVNGPESTEGLLKPLPHFPRLCLFLSEWKKEEAFCAVLNTKGKCPRYLPWSGLGYQRFLFNRVEKWAICKTFITLNAENDWLKLNTAWAGWKKSSCNFTPSLDYTGSED